MNKQQKVGSGLQGGGCLTSEAQNAGDLQPASAGGNSSQGSLVDLFDVPPQPQTVVSQQSATTNQHHQQSARGEQKVGELIPKKNLSAVSNKTQTKTTPQASLSPVISPSPAASVGASSPLIPNPTSQNRLRQSQPLGPTSSAQINGGNGANFGLNIQNGPNNSSSHNHPNGTSSSHQNTAGSKHQKNGSGVFSGTQNGSKSKENQQSASQSLACNPNWLAQASEQIEKTIEFINGRKIKEALQILMELDTVFEQSGIYVPSSMPVTGDQSTKTTSPIPGLNKPGDLTFARRNKSAMQLSIITKYNLACCFQSLNESAKCIRYLQAASRQLSFYSNMDSSQNSQQGLFKVKKTSGYNSVSKKDGALTPLEQQPSTNNARQAQNHSNLEFNEYNCVGGGVSSGDPCESPPNGDFHQRMQQSHEQLSAQLQANRYLCKFHLQLCAIMSQMGQHVQANENGQQASAIAEVILMKTHEFCSKSVEELLARDGKQFLNSSQNGAFASQGATPGGAADTLGGGVVSPEQNNIDYVATAAGAGSQKSSIYMSGPLHLHQLQTTNSSVGQTPASQAASQKGGDGSSTTRTTRRLNRESSVTSLYSQEKERKSVSIRRSRTRTNSVQGGKKGASAHNARDASLTSEDSTHKSLERMYTFNLSKPQQQTSNASNNAKNPQEETDLAKKENQNEAILPQDQSEEIEQEEARNGADVLSLKDNKNCGIVGGKPTGRPHSRSTREKSTTKTNGGLLNQNNPSGSNQNQNNNLANQKDIYAPTYQVLERTNIQEKQLLNVHPLLNEFMRISSHFNQRNPNYNRFSQSIGACVSGSYNGYLNGGEFLTGQPAVSASYPGQPSSIGQSKVASDLVLEEIDGTEQLVPNSDQKVTANSNNLRRISQPTSTDLNPQQTQQQQTKKATFGSLSEINQLKTNKRFKINVRNTLGVKDHNNWIYNLNIGNVMNLTPMNSDELNTQQDVFQELSKDTMLEKIILYVVAYFCVGTEIRFQATKMEKKESSQEFHKVWQSEMWHGKSLQTACLFLPEDCPLVDHIIKSYKKHYIGKQSLLSVIIKPLTPVVAATDSNTNPLNSSRKPTTAKKKRGFSEKIAEIQTIGESSNIAKKQVKLLQEENPHPHNLLLQKKSEHRPASQQEISPPVEKHLKNSLQMAANQQRIQSPPIDWTLTSTPHQQKPDLLNQKSQHGSNLRAPQNQSNQPTISSSAKESKRLKSLPMMLVGGGQSSSNANLMRSSGGQILMSGSVASNGASTGPEIGGEQTQQIPNSKLPPKSPESMDSEGHHPLTIPVSFSQPFPKEEQTAVSSQYQPQSQPAHQTSGSNRSNGGGNTNQHGGNGVAKQRKLSRNTSQQAQAQAQAQSQQSDNNQQQSSSNKQNNNAHPSTNPSNKAFENSNNNSNSSPSVRRRMNHQANSSHHSGTTGTGMGNTLQQQQNKVKKSQMSKINNEQDNQLVQQQVVNNQHHTLTAPAQQTTQTKQFNKGSSTAAAISFNDIQRLQHNLNLHIKQSQKKQVVQVHQNHQPTTDGNGSSAPSKGEQHAGVNKQVQAQAQAQAQNRATLTSVASSRSIHDRPQSAQNQQANASQFGRTSQNSLSHKGAQGVNAKQSANGGQEIGKGGISSAKHGQIILQQTTNGKNCGLGGIGGNQGGNVQNDHFNFQLMQTSPSQKNLTGVSHRGFDSLQPPTRTQSGVLVAQQQQAVSQQQQISSSQTQKQKVTKHTPISRTPKRRSQMKSVGAAGNNGEQAKHAGGGSTIHPQGSQIETVMSSTFGALRSGANGGNMTASSSGNNGSNVVTRSSRKRAQQQSVSSSLQKLVSKPLSSKTSHLLHSESLAVNQGLVWPNTLPPSTNTQQHHQRGTHQSGKSNRQQKVMMLQKTKSNHMLLQSASVNTNSHPSAKGNQTATSSSSQAQNSANHPQQSNAVLWLAQNKASDKLQSKYPLQIGNTKFVDSQLKMLAGNNGGNTSNQVMPTRGSGGASNTTRGHKKSSAGNQLQATNQASPAQGLASERLHGPSLKKKIGISKGPSHDISEPISNKAGISSNSKPYMSHMLGKVAGNSTFGNAFEPSQATMQNHLAAIEQSGVPGPPGAPNYSHSAQKSSSKYSTSVLDSQQPHPNSQTSASSVRKSNQISKIGGTNPSSSSNTTTTIKKANLIQFNQSVGKSGIAQGSSANHHMQHQLMQTTSKALTMPQTAHQSTKGSFVQASHHQSQTGAGTNPRNSTGYNSSQAPSQGLKKSASTRHVVNLLDSYQPSLGSATQAQNSKKGGHFHQVSHGGYTYLNGPILASKHHPHHNHVSGNSATTGSSNKGGMNTHAANSYTMAPSQTTSKKLKSTKSTGLLHQKDL